MALSDMLATGLEAGLPILGAGFGPVGVAAGGMAGPALYTALHRRR